MRVDAPDLANSASDAVPSHYRPYTRYGSAITGVADAGLLPTVTVKHLNQDASGTLSPPASRAGLRWARGGGKTSDCGDLGQCGQRSPLGKPRTSRGGLVDFQFCWNPSDVDSAIQDPSERVAAVQFTDLPFSNGMRISRTHATQQSTERQRTVVGKSELASQPNRLPYPYGTAAPHVDRTQQGVGASE